MASITSTKTMIRFSPSMRHTKLVFNLLTATHATLNLLKLKTCAIANFAGTPTARPALLSQDFSSSTKSLVIMVSHPNLLTNVLEAKFVGFAIESFTLKTSLVTVLR